MDGGTAVGLSLDLHENPLPALDPSDLAPEIGAAQLSAAEVRCGIAPIVLSHITHWMAVA
jgi:hypothetical protein